MAFGIDYVTAPPLDALKAAGVTFVCRYLSEVNAQTQVKLLTPEEAKALSAAGIALVSNYEWYAERPLEGEAAGVADAKIAESQHAACGGPADRPIYFSVDIDVDGAQVADYFRGVASVIGLARTGAYGSFRVLQWLKSDGLISWLWQTYAWSAGLWLPGAHIQQYDNGKIIGGRSVDYDRSMTADYGQWGGAMHLPTGWSDDSHTLSAPTGKAVLGFRQHILDGLKAGTWRADDYPYGEQLYAPQLERSNPDLGDGDLLYTRYGVLEYPHNPTGAVAHLKQQVITCYAGLELNATREQYNALKAQYQALQAELAKSPAMPQEHAAVEQIKAIVATLP